MGPFTVVFLLDTSASMNQRMSGGITLLDCAKSSIEHFIKVRSRDPASKMDTYVLVTCEDGPQRLRALDKFPFTTFTAMLKTVTAKDLSLLGTAVKQGLDLLNLNRLLSSADTYAHGYLTAAMEPAMLILLTDGTEENLQLPMVQHVGAELSKQPFRWDQRVFTVFLRMPCVLSSEAGASNAAAAAAPTEVSGADNAVAAMCEVTGGRGLGVGSLRALLHAMESLVARMQPCVVVSFEQMSGMQGNPLPPLPKPTAAACRHRLLTVRGPGIWPIPEAFRVEALGNNPMLPPREAQPTIGYIPMETDPHVTAGFPVDVYELEACPISGFMISAHQSGMPDSFCWQVFSPGLSAVVNGPPEPYGYLRLNRKGNIVCLHLMPLNYVPLVKLMDQIVQMPANLKLSPPPAWRQELERYCASLPSYYLTPLRGAFKRMGLPSQLVPELRESLPGSIANHLKNLHRQAKVESDVLFSVIQRNQSALQRIANAGSEMSGGQAFTGKGPSSGSTLALEPTFGNVFQISRSQLMGHVSLLSTRLHSASQSLFKRTAQQQSTPIGVIAEMEKRKQQAAKHTVPITSMGDYHEMAMLKAPPRNPYVDDEERTRQQRVAFGNPYKKVPTNVGAGNVTSGPHHNLDEGVLLDGDIMDNMMEMDGIVDVYDHNGPRQTTTVGRGGRGFRTRQRASSEPPLTTAPSASGTASATSSDRRGGADGGKGRAGSLGPQPPATRGISTSTSSNSTGSRDGPVITIQGGPGAEVSDASSSEDHEALRSPVKASTSELAGTSPSPSPPKPDSSPVDKSLREPKAAEPKEPAAVVDAAAIDAMWASALRASGPTEPVGAKRKSIQGADPERRDKRRSQVSKTPEAEVKSPPAPAAPTVALVPRGSLMEPDIRGSPDPSLQLLRVFHSHREGMVDMSDQVLKYLCMESFGNSRVQWVKDLLDAAQCTRKHTLAATLSKVLADPGILATLAGEAAA